MKKIMLLISLIVLSFNLISAADIVCEGTTYSVSNIDNACCSPIDCDGAMCDLGMHQCVGGDICLGDGFTKCSGYVTTIKVDASGRYNYSPWSKYTVWDAMLIHTSTPSKTGNQLITKSGLLGKNYCILDGKGPLENNDGKYMYDFLRSYTFAGSRFCGYLTAPANSFCIDSSAGIAYIDQSISGISYVAEGTLINVYEKCNGCTSADQCTRPIDNPSCYKYDCVNNKCMIKTNMEAYADPANYPECQFNEPIAKCMILGIPNKVYQLADNFQITGTSTFTAGGQERTGCLIVTAENITIDGRNALMPSFNPNYGAFIYSDQKDTEIKNLNINMGSDSRYTSAILLDKTSKNSWVHDNVIGAAYGLSIYSGSNTNIIVEDNEFFNSHGFGSGIVQSLGSGYWTSSPASSYNVFRNNYFHDLRDYGMQLETTRATIEGNIMEGNGIALRGRYSTIKGNVLDNANIEIYGGGAMVWTNYVDILNYHSVTKNKVCNGGGILAGDQSQISVFSDNQCDTTIMPDGCTWSCSEIPTLSCGDCGYFGTDCDQTICQGLGDCTYFNNKCWDQCSSDVGCSAEGTFCEAGSEKLYTCSLGQDGCYNRQDIENCGAVGEVCRDNSLCVKEINSCQRLDESGTIYRLTKDLIDEEVVNTDFGCITITEPDITLDCQNHKIHNLEFYNAGIYSKAFYVTIKNCDVRTGNGGAAGAGIMLDSVYQNRIMNNILDFNFVGIWVYKGISNVFEGNTGHNNDGGIYVEELGDNSFNQNQFCLNGIFGDFRCSSSTGNFGTENKFTDITSCSDGWPVLGTDYTECV